MPPKAKAAPVRSARYTAVLAELKAAKERAAQELKAVRQRKKNEERRHRRIIRKASMLGASELMEIASLRHLSLQQLADHAAENNVPAGGPAEEPPAPNPPEPHEAGDAPGEHPRRAAPPAPPAEDSD